jgi:NAD+ synthase
MDYAQATHCAARDIREAAQGFCRRTAIVGLSGGIDSSVCAALSARALGVDRVVGIIMPDDESADFLKSRKIANEVVSSLGIHSACEPISGILRAAGCYASCERIVHDAIPEYDSGIGWRFRLRLNNKTDALPTVDVVAQDDTGEIREARLTPSRYREIIAALNFKQRTRSMILYRYADMMNGIVVGTTNKLEYDQGFFVRGGDGLSDVSPIKHLYKQQVYALGHHLMLPSSVTSRAPTPDTHSLASDPADFFYALDYKQMDACIYGIDAGFLEDEIAESIGVEVPVIHRACADIRRKRIRAAYTAA